MKIIQVIKLNARIIHVLNSCDRRQFINLVNDVVKTPEVFQKKYYVWNIIRSKDFYKMMAFYVIQLFEDSYQYKEYDKEKYCEVLNQAEFIMKLILDTTKEESIRKSFIWNIMKQVPVITVDTIQYASHEKINSILHSNKDIIVDEALTPIVEEIKSLNTQVITLKEEISALRTMIE